MNLYLFILERNEWMNEWKEWMKKEMNTFIQQGCIKIIKSGSIDIYNVTKALYFR